MFDLRAGVKRYLFEGEVLRLMGFAALVKPIGLVTQMVIASSFGAGLEYDAYVLAVFLVSFFDAAVGQVFNAVAVPFFIKLRQRIGRREFFAFQNTIFLYGLVPVALFIVLLIVRGDLVIGLVGPRLVEESRDYAARMLRMLALPGLALVIIAMMRSTLNLNRRFRVPASMPILNSVVMLIAVILLRERFGIWSLVIGFAASSLLRMLIMVIFAWRQELIAWVRPSAPEGTLGEFWSLSWMILVAQLMLTVNGYADRVFASGLEVGSISSITYSRSIENFGLMLFRSSLVVVMFTKMSEFLADGKMAACSRYIESNLRRMVRIVVPVSLGLSVCGVEIVRVLLQRGAFDTADTERTAAALSMYMLGMPALIVNGVITRAYHSMQRMRDRMWLAAQYLITNVVGNYILIKYMGISGLALASVLAINLHVVLGLWLLHRYDLGMRVGRFSLIILQSYLLGTATAVIYWLSGAHTWLSGLVTADTVVGDIVTAACRFLFILIVFFAGYTLLWWLRRSRTAS